MSNFAGKSTGHDSRHSCVQRSASCWGNMVRGQTTVVFCVSCLSCKLLSLTLIGVTDFAKMNHITMRNRLLKYALSEVPHPYDISGVIRRYSQQSHGVLCDGALYRLLCGAHWSIGCSFQPVVVRCQPSEGQN